MNKTQGVAYQDKLPLFCETVNDEIIAYDGKQYYTITNEQKSEIRSLKTEFILIQKNKDRDRKKVCRGKWVEKTLKEMYDDFMRDATELNRQRRTNSHKSCVSLLE